MTEMQNTLPHALYVQIKEILAQFEEMRGEAAGILRHSQMPDNTAQLNDVLQSTEIAANTILDMVTLINTITAEGTAQPEDKSRINECVCSIYEACSFQDISGQRINKVLKSLGVLESRLQKLAHSTKNYAVEKPPASNSEASLLGGPQLAKDAPTQADIDKIFG